MELLDTWPFPNKIKKWLLFFFCLLPTKRDSSYKPCIAQSNGRGKKSNIIFFFFKFQTKRKEGTTTATTKKLHSGHRGMRRVTLIARARSLFRVLFFSPFFFFCCWLILCPLLYLTVSWLEYTHSVCLCARASVYRICLSSALHYKSRLEDITSE